MIRAVQEFPPADESVLVPGGMDAFMSLVVVGMVAGVVLFLWLLVRNLRIMRHAGAGGRPSLAERMQELDDLHRRGLISDAEHAMARQRALTSS